MSHNTEGSTDLPRVAAPEKRTLLDGMSRQGIKADKHPPWYPPANGEDPATAAAHPLHVLNSFTEKVERFVPQADAADQGNTSSVPPAKRRRVTWYTCGPTVYDVSHMGHARAYLTFDILRRVFEDYFNYEVVLQMNITDIDDKIIKRARIGKLLSDYEKAAKTVDGVKADVVKAKEFAKGVLAARREALSKPLPENAQSRIVEEREEKLKELELKESQFVTNAEVFDATVSAQGSQVADAVKAGTPFLGDWLDHERGATVTDNAIFDAHARKFEKLFFEDLTALNIREPDIVTRVSEVVPEVVEFVEKIMSKGYAYLPQNVSEPSSIFFDTQKYIADGHDYPKLKPVADHLRNSTATTEDEMAEGEGSLSMGSQNEKKHPNDFALWKFSKPGEPGWDCPWGRKGRPGWHIECSVMASGVLGPSMDIHAGGCDLKFPHHDNELAQSEAYWGHSQWVNYFLHCGHLHIKGLKMSKSLKNFITIRQAMDQEGELKITSREMRLLFLMNDWHRSLNFSDQSVGAARQVERTLRSFFGSVDIVLRSNWLGAPQPYTQLDKDLMAAWKTESDAVHAAMCNNIDTVTVMDSIMNLVSAGNKYLNAVQAKETAQAPNATLLQKVAGYATRILRVFGVVNSSDGIGFEEKGGAGANAAADNRLGTAMDALIMLRDDVRRATREKAQAVQVMAMCDKVRDDVLPAAGIRLEDKPGAGGGTTWKRDDPAVLMRERAERVAAAQAQKVKSLGNQITTQEKLIAKWEKLARNPTEYFRGDAAERAKYSQFDATTGLPTHDSAGAALDEKKAGKLKTTQASYAKQHGEYQEKGGDEWLGKLKKELADMKAALEEAKGGQSQGAAAAAASA